MATSWLSNRPLHLVNLPADRGDTVLELDRGTVLVRSRAGFGEGEGESGGLKLCKCIKTEWKCEQHEDGMYCYDVCIAWDCKEVPTPL